VLVPRPAIAVTSQHQVDGKLLDFMDDLGMKWIFWASFMLRYEGLSKHYAVQFFLLF